MHVLPTWHATVCPSIYINIYMLRRPQFQSITIEFGRLASAAFRVTQHLIVVRRTACRRAVVEIPVYPQAVTAVPVEIAQQLVV